jgi:L-iditol 2-dehydrogenase
MKAAFLYGQQDIRLEDVNPAPVEAYGLRIKVLSCGVCGSDARMFFTGPTPRYLHPVILGHELSGKVVEVGDQLEDFAVGDLVTLAPIVPCMRCPACSRGLDNLCQQAQVIGCTVHGGMAEYVSVPSQMVLAGGAVKLPRQADHRAAALTELVGCCLRGLYQMNITPGDKVLIIGDGPIGLTFVQLVRLMGAGYVVTSGRRSRRRELAVELGADEALNAQTVNLRERFEQSMDQVIIAAANIQVTAEAVELLRPGGSLLLFSGYTYGTALSLDVNSIHYRQLHIHGSIDCTVRDFRTAASLLPQLQMEKLISASFPLEKTVEAFLASKERDAVKVIIEP